MESKCLLRGILCIKFAISNKVKNKIGTEKLTTINDIDIKPVSSKYFFCIVRRKNYEDYM